jgi:NAD(P)-dependent dehydrogenase (short-subunit alcohol dehydrogenase family)
MDGDMKSFAGRVAVITGAGSGLGAAIADVLAGENMSIGVLDIDEGSAEATAGSVIERGGRATSCRVDVADVDSLQSAAHHVTRELGGCDLLCANVGVQQFGALDRLTIADWRWMVSVNVLGTIQTVNAFLPLLRDARPGAHILLTASSGVFTPGVRLGAYTTTKYAVVGYGETLRQELEPEGIQVSILFPAGMSTRHLESSAAARPSEFGPSIMRDEDIEAMLSSREYDAATDMISADDAVRNLVRALRDDEHYIFTHGRYRDILVRRGQELLAAYDRMAAEQARPE